MSENHNQQHGVANLATPLDRLLAFLIDIGVFVIATTPTAVADDSPIAVILSGIPFLLLFITQIVLIWERSQTIGKHFIDIFVVRKDSDKRIGFWRFVLLRDFVGKTLILGAIPFIQVIFYPIYFIIDSLFIFRKDRRTVHDMVAGTVVVRLDHQNKRKKLFDFTVLPK